MPPSSLVWKTHRWKFTCLGLVKGRYHVHILSASLTPKCRVAGPTQLWLHRFVPHVRCADTDWQDVESNLAELQPRFHGPVPIYWRVPPRNSRGLWVSCQERALLISHPVTWSWTFRNMHPAESHPFAWFLRLGSRSKEEKMLLLAGSFNIFFPSPLVMTINTQSYFHTSVLKAVWPTDDVVLWLCSNP